MWSELLGFGDFYYELGVQAVEACMSNRQLNGGLVEIGDLVALVNKRRGTKVDAVSRDDVVQAIKKLGKLGSGFQLVQIGQKTVVQSVPGELNRDHSQILSQAEVQGGWVTSKGAQEKLGFTSDRVQQALQVRPSVRPPVLLPRDRKEKVISLPKARERVAKRDVTDLRKGRADKRLSCGFGAGSAERGASLGGRWARRRRAAVLVPLSPLQVGGGPRLSPASAVTHTTETCVFQKTCSLYNTLQSLSTFLLHYVCVETCFVWLGIENPLAISPS